MLRQLRVLVGIDLGEQEAAGIFLGELFEQRLQYLAGLAPRCPEIDDDRHFLGRQQDLGFEFGEGDVKGILGHGVLGEI